MLLSNRFRSSKVTRAHCLSLLCFTCFSLLHIVLYPSALSGQSAHGVVEGFLQRDGDDQPVHAEITVEGRSGTFWSNSAGYFSMAVPPYDVGSFYRITVRGWIVDAPCAPPRGGFNLPKPGANPVVLYLSPLRPNLDLSAFTCSMKSYAFSFPQEPPTPAAGTSNKPAQTMRKLPHAQLVAPGFPYSVPLLLSSYVSASAREGGMSTRPDNADPNTYKREFVRQESEQLHLSRTEFELGVSRWIESAKTPYQSGLGSLYRGDYANAEEFFLKALQSAERSDRTDWNDKWVCLSRAQFGLGKYEAAERSLTQAFTEMPDSPAAELVKKDLLVVADAKKRTEPSRKDLKSQAGSASETDLAAPGKNVVTSQHLSVKPETAVPPVSNTGIAQPETHSGANATRSAAEIQSSPAKPAPKTSGAEIKGSQPTGVGQPPAAVAPQAREPASAAATHETTENQEVTSDTGENASDSTGSPRTKKRGHKKDTQEKSVDAELNATDTNETTTDTAKPKRKPLKRSKKTTTSTNREQTLPE